MVHKLIKVFRYKPSSDPNEHVAANELIYNIKRDRRVDLLNFIGDEMAEAIKHSIDPEKYIITNVPRKKSRVLHYGLDHAEEIAKNISKKLGIPYVSLLVSKSRTAQKKVRGEERIKNASFDQRRGAKDVTGKRIILVDDIVTTGASMGAAAMMIRAMGAKEVVGACLAITFNDKYTPFIKTEY